MRPSVPPIGEVIHSKHGEDICVEGIPWQSEQPKVVVDPKVGEQFRPSKDETVDINKLSKGQRSFCNLLYDIAVNI